MSKTPFMPLWVSDFLGDTLDLGDAEVGAYMLLLMAQWQRGGASLPDDAEKLRRIARSGRGWPKIWGTISRYFERDEDGLYSKRLRFESASVAAKREVNGRNGARGGKAKALKSKEPALANATNSLYRNPSIPEPEPEPYRSIGGGDGSARENLPPAEQGQPRTFRDRILIAMGCDVSGMTGRGGTWIGTEADMMEARRWLSDLGLTGQEVLTVVAEVMGQRRESGPPSKFRYFTKAMQRFAAEKAATSTRLSPAEMSAPIQPAATDTPAKPKFDLAAGLEKRRKEQEESANVST